MHSFSPAKKRTNRSSKYIYIYLQLYIIYVYMQKNHIFYNELYIYTESTLAIYIYRLRNANIDKKDMYDHVFFVVNISCAVSVHKLRNVTCME